MNATSKTIPSRLPDEAGCTSETALREGRPTPDPDAWLAQLLTVIATGDRDAFSELHLLTASRFMGLALHTVRDRALAEDVVQESYFYIWANCCRFDASRGRALPWMSAIVNGRAIDAVRSTEARSRREAAWGRRQCDTASDSTADLVHATADALRVREALQALSDKQRSALTLAFFEGHSHHKVAERLGVPLGTAKARIRDGMRIMSTTLARAGT